MTLTLQPREFELFWQTLETLVTSVPSTDTVFNQYSDCNADVDLPSAASIRTANLQRYLASACALESASVLVIGEAAGPWGCRFSGIPFISERQLLDSSFPYRGERSSRTDPQRVTKIAPPFTSNSAEIFWEVMRPYYHRFVLWDAFPLHPHKSDDALMVRNPSRVEVSQFSEALRLIKAYVNPAQIVAIGRKAFDELELLGQEPVYVRHPSRGGKAQFTRDMRRLFKDYD